MTEKTISITPRRHDLYDVRLGCYSSTLNVDELRKLHAKIRHALGDDWRCTPCTDDLCTKCAQRPRAWVQSVFCGSCIAENLREDLMLDGPHCDKCESAPRYDGPLCAGCLAAMEGR